MEENNSPHPDYQKGFNEGYLMKKHLPDLADKIVHAIDPSERGTGFRDGKAQCELEQKNDRYPRWLRDDRLSNLDKGKDETKGKDRDDMEPEK